MSGPIVPALPSVELQKLWSVTTIVKIALGTSDALVRWGERTVAEVAVDSQETWRGMAQREGREAATKWIIDRRHQHTSRAAARGTALHAVFEAYAKGAELPKVEDDLRPYVERYIEWLDAHRPEYVLAEAPVYNVEESYAGTLDGIMRLDGLPLVFDYKTTEYPLGGEKARPPWPEVALQLVAYRHATEVGILADRRYDGRSRRYYLYDPTSRREPMPEVEGALCIVVSPDACVAHPIVVTGEVWDAFLDVREAARWQLETSRHVVRPIWTKEGSNGNA